MKGTGTYCISWPIVSKEYPDKQVGTLLVDQTHQTWGQFFDKSVMPACLPTANVRANEHTVTVCVVLSVTSPFIITTEIARPFLLGFDQTGYI